MVNSCTNGSGCADVVKEAGVHAVVLDASPIGGAVGVDVTLHGLAAHEWVADES